MSRRIAALIRHGEFARRADVPSALQPWPLTTHGQHQAHSAGTELGRNLRANGWTLHPDVHCAPQLRTWETAILLADALADITGTRPEIAETEALAERGLGAAANLTVAEIEAMLAADARHALPPDDWRTDSFYRLPVQGAESLMDAGRRVAAYLDDTVPPGDDDDAPVVQIFVGHGAALRHAAHILGILDLEQLTDLRLAHAQPVVLERHADGNWTQISGTWRETSHTAFSSRRRRRRTGAT